ncbi:MAG: DUF1343 domain-containing protein [Elusimicrobia bacterium CG08_land_8_20_14_0_20_51_18]|nr:MAG: DUF1343 domain-containing protein [Elusimicrobia bacterium CG08_land_8_20_14_0_20_51_18]
MENTNKKNSDSTLLKFLLFILLAATPLNAQVTQTPASGEKPAFSGQAGVWVMTLSGLDALEKNGFAGLEDKKVGLITNHTALDAQGRGIVEAFKLQSKFQLKALFSPEHGFTGQVEGGVHIQSSTGTAELPLYSLYGKNKRPSEEMLRGLDLLVFDIQDVGARFYTYLTTMGYAMEEASKYGIAFMVLDRPNPVGLETVEGPVLAPQIDNFTAYFKVPARHGLTAGEMALFHKKKLNLNLDLKIIEMENYSRGMFFDETGQVWINPSPNIRDLKAAVLYSGIGCFEATNVSVGRGTERPFRWFGAPWMKAEKLVKKLNGAGFKGVRFSYAEKTPDADMYKGELCRGVEIEITDKTAVRAMDIFVHSAWWLNKINKKDFVLKKDDIARMTGTYDFYEMIKAGKKPEEIIKFFDESNAKFKEEVKNSGILLYK